MNKTGFKNKSREGVPLSRTFWEFFKSVAFRGMFGFGDWGFGHVVVSWGVGGGLWPVFLVVGVPFPFTFFPSWNLKKVFCSFSCLVFSFLFFLLLRRYVLGAMVVTFFLLVVRMLIRGLHFPFMPFSFFLPVGSLGRTVFPCSWGRGALLAGWSWGDCSGFMHFRPTHCPFFSPLLHNPFLPLLLLFWGDLSWGGPDCWAFVGFCEGVSVARRYNIPVLHPCSNHDLSWRRPEGCHG